MDRKLLGGRDAQDDHSTPASSDAYGRYCKPALVERLAALRLDVTYERAEGDHLWYRAGGRPRRVLDLVGGYGTNLLGHNHPDLVAVAWGRLQDRVPVFAQASVRGGAGRLAEALCRRLGDFVVTFTNSGTEAVEAALKHAYLERRRPLFWAVKGGFHGKTLGSVQLTWSQRDVFSGMGPQVRYLDPDDPDDWAAARAEADLVCAAVIEPIAGEGGVRPRSLAFAQWLAATCREHQIPVIADEIQTGMGRTGNFLASEAIGLAPDYVCLGKALGGGLAKIGAMLVRRERFIPEFSLLHSSTFAEDDPGCDLGVEVLRLLDRDNLPARCADRGKYLSDRLEAIRVQYPDVIHEVRGRGLMVGLELRSRDDSPSYVLRAASQQGLLGYLAASYFLRHHDIRVMPTLSQPLTLRVQPSAYIGEPELARFADAVESLCRVLRSNDAGRLLDVDGLRSPPPAVYTPRRTIRREPPRARRRVAFLTHLLSDDHLGDLDPSLADSSPANLAAMLDRTARVWEPVLLDQTRVASPTGDSVHLSVIGLGMSARQMISAYRPGTRLDRAEARSSRGPGRAKAVRSSGSAGTRRSCRTTARRSGPRAGPHHRQLPDRGDGPETLRRAARQPASTWHGGSGSWGRREYREHVRPTGGPTGPEVVLVVRDERPARGGSRPRSGQPPRGPPAR